MRKQRCWSRWLRLGRPAFQGAVLEPAAAGWQRRPSSVGRAWGVWILRIGSPKHDVRIGDGRWVAKAERRERGGSKTLQIAEKIAVSRCKPPGDRKPCIACSRRRSGRCEFSALLFSPLCDRQDGEVLYITWPYLPPQDILSAHQEMIIGAPAPVGGCLPFDMVRPYSTI